MKERTSRYFPNFSTLLRVICIFIITATSACSGLFNSPAPSNGSTAIPTTPEPTGVHIPQAEVTFIAKIPNGTPVNATVDLNVLDDVTGLALNAVQYAMKMSDNLHYETKIPVTVGSVIKYRYTREGNTPALEYNSNGQQVRYRIIQVTGPMTVNDNITAWNDAAYNGPSGRISGLVLDKNTNAPVPNLYVTSAGASTLSASDGSFILEGLPPGTHNLVVYSMDGAYELFQQYATVAEDSTTPAIIKVAPARMVKVTFTATVPQENVVGVPVRMAGNLYQTGNTFSDLAGGINTIASRMPLMTMEKDGQYNLTLSLPAGADFRYKYTLGDGFWNSEQTLDGHFQVRQLIVPDQDTQIQDTISTWRSGGSASVSFEVKVPEDTPTGDSISIQFNPYGWTEPLPMWSLGGNKWLYILYSPLNLISNMSYRYCRNDQCGAADNSATAGNSAPGTSFTITNGAQNIQDQVSSWQDWKVSTTPTTVVAAEIKPRGSNFVAGVELTPYYHPSWQSRYIQAYQGLQQIGTTWIINTPAWTFTHNNPPVIEPVPGSNPLWDDALQQVAEVGGLKMNSAVFPTPLYQPNASQWWQSAKRDFGWWQVWFNRYHEFLVSNADLAARAGAKSLILGGDSIGPALPGGTVADGSSSGVPSDAAARWKTMIQDVRSHFSGSILWAVSYPSQTKNPPSFLDSVDGIYLLWSAPLSDQKNPTEADMQTEMGRLLDTNIEPLQKKFQKPLILAVAYPSVEGSALGCVPTTNSACAQTDILSQPNPDLPNASVNLQQQVDIYNAVFAAINQRSWISGVVSRGYYPPVALQDKSNSVHGKPATDVLWYWFPRLTAASGQ